MGKLLDSKVEVHVTYRCLYDCVFCSVNKHLKLEPTKDEIFCDIDITKKYYKLTITGGEPTLRNDLVDIVNYARKYHNNILLETNGTLLTKSKIQELLNAGLTEVKLSVYSNDENTCSRMSRNQNCFSNVKKALESLAEFSSRLRISTNTVITKYNAKSVCKTILWLQREFPFLEKTRVSYPRFYPIKGKVQYCKIHVVPLTDLKQIMNEIVQKADNKRLILENFPLCLVNSPTAKDMNWNILIAINGKVINGLEERYYPEACQNCLVKKDCQGVHKYYSQYYSLNFIKPIT